MDIASKIKKLLHLADTKRNSNVEEAASAAAKAQKLMEKHRIQMAMLTDDFQIITKYLDDRGKPENWKVFLATVLAKSNGCFIIKSEKYSADNKVLVAGLEKDIDTLQYLYTYIVSELNRMCLAELFKLKNSLNINPRPSFVNSFYLGAINIIDQRLQTANKEIRDAETKNAILPEEKILLNFALQKIDNRINTTKQWVKENLNAKVENITLNSVDSHGFNIGQTIAKEINLDSTKKLDKK